MRENISIRAAKEASTILVTTVDLRGTTISRLNDNHRQQPASRSPKERLAFANSDAVYRQLRSDGLGDTFRCEISSWDRRGNLRVLKIRNDTILRRSVNLKLGAVFVGQGHFTLKPILLSTPMRCARAPGSDRGGGFH